MNLAEAVAEVEAAGVALRLDGDKVKLRYPAALGREEFAIHIELLRRHRTEVAEMLRDRGSAPEMPNGIGLVKWQLKPPPVVLEYFAVVTEPEKFAKSTLEQLGRAIAKPSRWVGWSIPQLLDRLFQVGVIVEPKSKRDRR